MFFCASLSQASSTFSDTFRLVGFVGIVPKKVGKGRKGQASLWEGTLIRLVCLFLNLFVSLSVTQKCVKQYRHLEYFRRLTLSCYCSMYHCHRY